MKTTKIVICMVLVSNILFSAEDVKVEEIKIPKKKCKKIEEKIYRENPETKKCIKIDIKTDCELKELIYNVHKLSSWNKCPEIVPSDNLISMKEQKLINKYETNFEINEPKQIEKPMIYPTTEEELELLKNNNTSFILEETNLIKETQNQIEKKETGNISPIIDLMNDEFQQQKKEKKEIEYINPVQDIER
jgi:hypothetical protein